MYYAKSDRQKTGHNENSDRSSGHLKFDRDTHTFLSLRLAYLLLIANFIGNSLNSSHG